MAWAYVDGVSILVAGPVTTANTTGTTLDLVVGNHVIVATMISDLTGTAPTMSSVTDNASPPNTYVKLGTTYNFNSNNGRLDFWLAEVTTAKTDAVISATASGSVDQAVTIQAIQLSGLAASPHDTGYAPTGNNDTASVYTTTADDTAEDNEVIVGAFINFFGACNYSSSSPSVVRSEATVNGQYAMATNSAAAQGSWTVSVVGSTNGSHFCRAVAFKQAAAVEYTKTVSLDAALNKAGLTKTPGIDGYLKKVETKTPSLDSYLKAIFTKTPSADALLNKAGQTKTADLDSLLNVLGLTREASLDAILYVAVTYYLTGSLDGYLQKGQTGTLGADALLQQEITKAVGTDGYLQKELTRTGSLDALLLGAILKTVGIDAALNKAGLTGSASIDALLDKLGMTKTASLDAVLLALAAKTLGIDAILYVEGATFEECSLDALLNKVGLTGSASIDAFLRRMDVSTSASLDAVLFAANTKTVGLDGYASKEFTGSASADAYLVRSAVAISVIDALLQSIGASRSSSLDAILFSETGTVVSAVIDALLRGVLSKSALMDGLLWSGFSNSASIDACLERIGVATGQRVAVYLDGEGTPSIDFSYSKPTIHLRNSRRIQ